MELGAKNLAGARIVHLDEACQKYQFLSQPLARGTNICEGPVITEV
jgi:hypothetical protein